MQEYLFILCLTTLLETGKLFTTHLGEVVTFPSVDKGTDIRDKPFLFRTPVTVFEGLIAASGS